MTEHKRYDAPGSLHPNIGSAINSAVAEAKAMPRDTKDSGLRLALTLAFDLLALTEEYFESRQDIDGAGLPNEAMRRLTDVQQVRHALARIVEVLP